jgi:hypothetical protein
MSSTYRIQTTGDRHNASLRIGTDFGVTAPQVYTRVLATVDPTSCTASHSDPRPTTSSAPAQCIRWTPQLGDIYLLSRLVPISGRVLSSLLFGVSPIDPVSLVLATTVLLAVGLGAAYAPAYRASRIDPMEVLRSE